MLSIGLDAFIIRTILNISYLTILVISTTILFEIFNQYSFDKIDLGLMTIYCLPQLISYAISTIGVTMIISHQKRNTSSNSVHCCSFIFFCINVTFSCKGEMSKEPCSVVRNYWNRISNGTIMQILDILSMYIINYVLLTFIPFLLLPAMYNENEDIRNFSLNTQIAIITINMFFHLFCLDKYGYYSLIIIIVAMIYIFIVFRFYPVKTHMMDIRWDVTAISKNSWSEVMRLSFEAISCIIMIFIAFSIKYDEERICNLSIIAFVNYIFPNIPLSATFFIQFYEYRLRQRLTKVEVGYCRFIEEFEEESSLYDKMYCLLHESIHIVADHDDNNEETRLLMVDKNEEKHRFNSILCFKMQYEYIKGNERQKKRMINNMHPRRIRQILIEIGIFVYLLSSLIAFLYPIIWFIYVWCYLTIVQDEGISDDGLGMNAKYMFIWIIFSIYCMLGCMLGLYWTKMIINGICFGKHSLMNRMRLISFMLSLKGYNFGDVDNAQQLFDRQGVISTVLASDCLQTDIALIILSYLYYSRLSHLSISIST